MMTEAECIEELLAKGWAEDTLQLVRERWRISMSFERRHLWFADQWIAAEFDLSALLRATMPGSAGVTVAAYFGLRNPGGG